jgi:hypothetical protein
MVSLLSFDFIPIYYWCTVSLLQHCEIILIFFPGSGIAKQSHRYRFAKKYLFLTPCKMIHSDNSSQNAQCKENLNFKELFRIHENLVRI